MLPLPPDPVLFAIGPLEVRWYGLLYAVGLFAVYQFMMREAKRRKLDAELIANGLIIISVAALVGGRLYHVVDAWDRYSANPIGALIPPYEGLGAPGGIVTGAIALAILLRRWKQSPWGWVDVAGPAILVMQAIARWGNWFNQELFGRATTLPWGLEIDERHLPDGFEIGTLFHPTFLYESLGNLVLCVALLRLDRRVALRPGRLFLCYTLGYSFLRFFVEGLRIDAAKDAGGLRLNQWTSLLVFVVSAAWLLVAWRRGALRVDPRSEGMVATTPIRATGSPDAPEQPE